LLPRAPYYPYPCRPHARRSIQPAVVDVHSNGGAHDLWVEKKYREEGNN
jgi:hypothetical protein